jgi:hypothetical protein
MATIHCSTIASILIQPSDIPITDFTTTVTPDGGMAVTTEDFTVAIMAVDIIQTRMTKTAITIMPAEITAVPVLVSDKLFRREGAAIMLMVTTGKIRNDVRLLKAV